MANLLLLVEDQILIADLLLEVITDAGSDLRLERTKFKPAAEVVVPSLDRMTSVDRRNARHDEDAG